MFIIKHVVLWGIIVCFNIFPLQAIAQSQPTKAQAKACVADFISEVTRNNRDIRTFALRYIHIPSVAAIVARRGYSYEESLRRIQRALNGNSSVAFRGLDVTTIVYLRNSGALPDPLRGTKAGFDYVYRLNAYYYRVKDKDKEDRETFSLWIRVIPGKCQLVDLSWNNASLSWAASR